MPELNNNQEQLRSSEVNEILSKEPNWILRWGINIIAIIIVGVILLSVFIQYSEVVIGVGNITTRVQPVKLRSKISGRLITIVKKDGEKVTENEIISIIENPISEDGVLYLQNIIATVRQHLQTKLSTNFSFFEADSNLVFADIQNDY